MTLMQVCGGHSEKDPPVPFPNTEVKLLRADGTAWVTMWESRSSPFFILEPRKGFPYGALLCSL